MNRFALALVAAAALAAPLAGPVAAQSMDVLLTNLTFPEPVVTSSTKNCDATVTAPTCQLEE